MILNTPTGKIITVQGSGGSLEVVSVGDYGKEKNMKEELKAARARVRELEERWGAEVGHANKWSGRAHAAEARAQGLKELLLWRMVFPD